MKKILVVVLGFFMNPHLFAMQIEGEKVTESTFPKILQKQLSEIYNYTSKAVLNYRKNKDLYESANILSESSTILERLESEVENLKNTSLWYFYDKNKIQLYNQFSQPLGSVLLDANRFAQEAKDVLDIAHVRSKVLGEYLKDRFSDDKLTKLKKKIERLDNVLKATVQMIQQDDQ